MIDAVEHPKAIAHQPPKPPISATVPDWSREALQRWWQPGRWLLKSIRDYQRAAGRGAWGRCMRPWAILRYRFWSIVTGAKIAVTCKIGGGMQIPHPNGIVIHPDVTIGPNGIIFQQVTIGNVTGKPGVPQIGGHVDIGAGAKILGPVTIGDHAQIGANAVVVHDVPEGATAIGVPARVIEPGASDHGRCDK